MRIHLLTRILTIVALLPLTSLAAEPLRLASVFTDNAVLQRGQAVPVWGWAEPGQTVVVAFAGQEGSAKTDQDGRWMVRLDALDASAKGQTLTVKTDGSSEAVGISNILVGEVWVCSGQSNMAFGLSGSVNGKATIDAAGDDQLRLFAAHAQATDESQESIGGSWAVDSPQSAGGFSAVGYYFGKALRKKLGVPVGLIRSAVGGTIAEAWTARDELEKNPTLKPLLDFQQQRIEAHPKAQAAYASSETKLLQQYEAAVTKAKAEGTRLPRKPQPPMHPSEDKNRPTGLYNGSIVPLQPYAIKGAIWYQGESNSSRGEQYRTLFPAMISSWRRAWGQGDFPFGIVQLANYQGQQTHPVERVGYHNLRDAQAAARRVPGAFLATAMDIGEGGNIHPRNKQELGRRLALGALAGVYGHADLVATGPSYKSMTIEGSVIRLQFDSAVGLRSQGEPLVGFVIAGEDRAFYFAKAEIDGETVKVWSEKVPRPVAVRYAWASNPVCNLYNAANLPAFPFRTEAWDPAKLVITDDPMVLPSGWRPK